MIRTLLIDDETHNRDTLRKMLARHCPQVSVVGEASGVKEGISAIQRLHPDLVLLDVNMNDGTGFDLLNAFSIIEFNVIFVSAFNKNMIRDFRLSGVEYLLKPVNPVELKAAADRADQIDRESLTLQLKALAANMQES
jgi:two-component system LytT family response regulator